MPKVTCVAIDAHSAACEICAKRRVQDPPQRWRVPTSIPRLRAVLEEVGRPVHLTLEEGPLAGWLLRNLRDHADRCFACDPRRNSLIAKGGDKDDLIDAEKLCDLLIGGYLHEVHHSDDLDRVTFKQQVSLYHERVGHRVAQANKIIGRLRCWGIVVRENAFADESKREELLARLGTGQPMQLVRQQLLLMLDAYDLAVKQEQLLRRGVEKLARKDPIAVSLQALPGVGWIRAATLVAYIDTPFRFKTKQALWKYMGVGLTREQSGQSRERHHVGQACNRILKNAIMGAAISVIRQHDGPFAQLHRRWLESGVSPANARRNVARALATTVYGMWKSRTDYDPQRVGLGPWT